jgi:PAS domain S-box-containing protein
MNSFNGLISYQNAIRFQNIVDDVAIVAMTDTSGTIIYVNDKFCKISQYSEQELIGQNHRIINSGYHPKSFFMKLWNDISQGQYWSGDIKNQAKDGSYYWVNTTIIPLLGEDGAIEKYFSYRYDITDRMLAYEQLKLTSQRLEACNEELQHFASIAAHDLQEPLRKIQVFSDRLSTKFLEDLPEEGVDLLNRIQTSSKRMQVLISDLLSYSQVTTRARPFSFVALSDVISQAVNDLEIFIEQTEGQIKYKNTDSLEIDPGQIRQLFQNLIANSLKFRREGVVPEVEIWTEVLHQSTSELGIPSCRITIKDNGIGFDQKFSEKIFTIFHRLHGRNEYEGTGIGLAICKKIVDRHRGTISAHSVLGKGSTFIITLPLKQSNLLSVRRNMNP